MTPKEMLLNLLRQIKGGETANASLLHEIYKAAKETECVVFEDVGRLLQRLLGGGVGELSSASTTFPLDRSTAIDVIRSEARRKDFDTVDLEISGELLRLLNFVPAGYSDKLGFDPSAILCAHSQVQAGDARSRRELTRHFFGIIGRICRRLKALRKQQPKLALLIEKNYCPPAGVVKRKGTEWVEEFLAMRLSAVLGSIAIVFCLAMLFMSQPAPKLNLVPSILQSVDQSLDELKKSIQGPTVTLLVMPDATGQSSGLTERLAGTENARVVGDHLIAQRLGINAASANSRWIVPESDLVPFAKKGAIPAERFLVAIFDNDFKTKLSTLRVLDATDGMACVFQKSGRLVASRIEPWNALAHLKTTKATWVKEEHITKRLVRIIDATIDESQLQSRERFDWAMTMHDVSVALGSSDRSARVKELLEVADAHPELPTASEHQMIGKLQAEMMQSINPSIAQGVK